MLLLQCNSSCWWFYFCSMFQAVFSFITMQLQLCSVFFTFSLGTRTHYFGRTILHGGAKVCLFLSFHTHTSTYILGNWFLCILNFANSTEQLVEVLWYVTSSLLKITGSTQEVILLKREYIYMNDFLLFSFSNGTCHPESRWGWEELGWFCLLKVVSFCYETFILFFQARSCPASHSLHSIWVHRWRCCVVCFVDT